MSCELLKTKKLAYDYCLNIPDKLYNTTYFDLLCERIKDTLECIDGDNSKELVWIYADNVLFEEVQKIVTNFNKDEYNFRMCDLQTVTLLINKHTNVVVFLTQISSLPMDIHNVTYVYVTLTNITIIDKLQRQRILRLFPFINTIENMSNEKEKKNFSQFIIFKQKYKKHVARLHSLLTSYNNIEMIHHDSINPTICPLSKAYYSAIIDWYQDYDIPLNSHIIGPYHTGYSIWNIFNDIHNDLIVAYRGFMMNLNVSTMNISQKPDEYLIHLFGLG